MNTGEDMRARSDAARVKVQRMQVRLHRWAGNDPGKKFSDLFNLVCDPDFLLVAWERVAANRGAQTPGIDSVTKETINFWVGAQEFIDHLRDLLRTGMFRPQPVRRVEIPKASGKLRQLGIPTMAACLKGMRDGDTLLVWKLDRLGRDLRNLVNTVHDLTDRGVGLKVLTGEGAAIDTTTASGKLVFGIFAALAEFERALISERTIAGLDAARARGRKGGWPYKMTSAKVRLAMAAMGQKETKVGALCEELGVTRQTLYRHVSPTGELRPDGAKLLNSK